MMFRIMEWRNLMWSYEVIDQTGPLNHNVLNELGKLGWELVSVVIPRNAHFIYYFKRPLREEPIE
jgi:hypothetical protein